MGLLDWITERLLARYQHRLGSSGDWEVVVVHKMPVVGPLRHVLSETEIHRFTWTARDAGAALEVTLRPEPYSIPVIRDLVMPMRDRLQIERHGIPVASVVIRTMTYDRLSGVIQLHGDSQRDLEDSLTERYDR